MPEADWDDALHAGFESMDEDHARQARTVHAIENAVRRGGEAGPIRQLLLGLIEDTRVHFEDEQDLMRRWGYPGYDAHAEAHRRLLEQLATIEARHVTGRLTVTEELVSSLRAWLVEHIRVMDHALARYLSDRVGEPGRR